MNLYIASVFSPLNIYAIFFFKKMQNICRNSKCIQITSSFLLGMQFEFVQSIPKIYIEKK